MDEQKITEDAVATMSRYVQFDTTNPPGNEMQAALWLRDQLVSRKITSDIKIYEPVAGRGLVDARISGTENLKPLMINHHIDVVAADSSKWTHPPFSGKVADGYFTPYKSSNHVVFFPTRYVELFSDALEKRVIKEIKKDRLSWSEMVKYQVSKK